MECVGGCNKRGQFLAPLLEKLSRREYTGEIMRLFAAQTSKFGFQLDHTSFNNSASRRFSVIVLLIIAGLSPLGE